MGSAVLTYPHTNIFPTAIMVQEISNTKIVGGSIQNSSYNITAYEYRSDGRLVNDPTIYYSSMGLPQNIINQADELRNLRIDYVKQKEYIQKLEEELKFYHTMEM